MSTNNAGFSPFQPPTDPPGLPQKKPDIKKIPEKEGESQGRSVKKENTGGLKDAFKSFAQKSDQPFQSETPKGTYDPHKPFSEKEKDFAKALLAANAAAPKPGSQPPIAATPPAPIATKPIGKSKPRPVIQSPATAVDQASLRTFKFNVSEAEAFLKQFETRKPESKDFIGIRTTANELLSKLGEIEKQIEGKLGTDVDALKNSLDGVKAKLLEFKTTLPPPPIPPRKDA